MGRRLFYNGLIGGDEMYGYPDYKNWHGTFGGVIFYCRLKEDAIQELIYIGATPRKAEIAVRRAIRYFYKYGCSERPEILVKKRKIKNDFNEFIVTAEEGGWNTVAGISIWANPEGYSWVESECLCSVVR